MASHELKMKDLSDSMDVNTEEKMSIDNGGDTNISSGVEQKETVIGSKTEQETVALAEESNTPATEVEEVEQDATAEDSAAKADQVQESATLSEVEPHPEAEPVAAIASNPTEQAVPLPLGSHNPPAIPVESAPPAPQGVAQLQGQVPGVTPVIQQQPDGYHMQNPAAQDVANLVTMLPDGQQQVQQLPVEQPVLIDPFAGVGDGTADATAEPPQEPGNASMHFGVETACLSLGMLAPSADGSGGMVPTEVVIDSKGGYCPASRENLDASGFGHLDVSGRVGKGADFDRRIVKARLDNWGQPSSRVWFEKAVKKVLRLVDFTNQTHAEIMVLYGAMTYCYKLFPAIPYLSFRGPKGSGKSKWQDALKEIGFRTVKAASATPAALYRGAPVGAFTMLLDEFEGFAKRGTDSVMEQVLNGGYKKGSEILRTNMDSLTPESFSPFFPKAFACIGGLNDVLASRCISIQTRRSTDPGKANQVVNPADKVWCKLRIAQAHFVLTEFKDIRAAYEGLATSLGPESRLVGRSLELWRPLLAIAIPLERMGVESLVSRIKDYAEEEIIASAWDSTDDFDRDMLRCLRGLFGQHGQTEIRTSPRALSDAMKTILNLSKLDKSISPERIGRALRRFGFKKLPRASRGVSYRVTWDDLQAALDEYLPGYEEMMRAETQ